MIFVFGSNLAGRHGKGAALFAREHKGAIYGQGVGLQNQCYAIPTKDRYLRVLGLDIINYYVQEFLDFARAHPELDFELTPIGCGLAGYDQDEIRPMFKDKPHNVYFNKDWR